jgi:hypothetical protein
MKYRRKAGILNCLLATLDLELGSDPILFFLNLLPPLMANGAT